MTHTPEFLRFTGAMEPSLILIDKNSIVCVDIAHAENTATGDKMTATRINLVNGMMLIVREDIEAVAELLLRRIN